MSSATPTKFSPLPPQLCDESNRCLSEAVLDVALDRVVELGKVCARDSLPRLLHATLPRTIHNDPILPRYALGVWLLPRIDVPKYATFLIKKYVIAALFC